ncbi:mucin-2-like isoform X3 [Sitodiplosis mosellana]|uniref:mucin-2-like isoform X3 n=1 Tax=Sitodiplosis mosellana TaxID=263140 RepID=UPI002445032B|nr:mucin-2-like isoform X3 [Sitodiplosis mosellana]
MKQLLRLLTALMLFFGLCHIVSAQRRGSTRFISSPDELTEWDSHKMASDSISRADVVFHDNAQSTRRGRYRTKTERPTMSSSSPSPSPSVTVSDDIVADLKTAKVPVYRVRGRNRSYKQYTENEKNLTETTTAKASGESSNRTVRRKSYQSNKQRTITRNENQSIETNQNKQKEAVSSTPYHATQTTSSRKYQTESESKSTTELPSNHQPENHRKTYGDVAATRKSPTGRRYRIRVVDANSINANADTAESEKKAMSLSSTTAADDVKTKAKKPDRDAVDEELNYPEHFKALLKSKKSTAAPYQVGSSRPNNFVSKKQIASSTVVPTEQTSTIRPTYKHKKIERPNLKLLFPSLHTSTGTTTTESTTAASTAIETDQTATDEFNTETNEPSDVTSTTVKIKTTVNKQIGGSKFSSKIRTDGGVSLAAFRPRSTPLVFETLKSTTQRSTGKPDVLTPNHRLSTGPVLDTPKFSARYKSGGDASSLAAYRKNLMREKPPFYTPTTPPITTQVNEIDWAASDYSYHYNDVEPIHSGLMQNPPLNVETSHHSSSSVTVSIFGALSEILSHTTESLSFLTSTTTEYTPLSHTHSTFLSTHDNHTPTQIQKIHSDKPKTPTMTGDSTTTTTNTNIDSNEFQLPILNAFDSNEAITSSKSSNEQVDAKLKTSSYSQFSTQAQNIAFSSTDASNLKSNLSDSINDNDSPVGVIDQMHSHMNHSNSNSGGIMIVLATSDRSSMQSNRTPYAIQHTEQPLKMQINTISEMLLDNSTTQTDATGTEYVSQSSTHRSKTNNDIVIPIYPVYAITTNSPIIHSPSSIDNQSLSTEPSTIDRPQQTTSMPITTTSTTTTTTTTSTKATITATVPTTTTMTIADLNLTETTEEHSLNSPSSNEVTSNESSSTVGNIDSDPFSLSAEHVDNKQPSVPITATSPKSNREYITSFTTTTTTTQKPHIEKGVKIIRELVEQARTTEEPDTNRPIQSLTTTKSIAKEKPVTTHKPKATSAPTVPANHRPTWAMESTSSRLPANHNFDGMDKTEKITENIAKTTYRSTSPRTTSRATTSSGSSTTTTTTRGGNMRSSTTEKMKIASSTVQIPISINDIEDLLQNIPTTTRRVKPTTTTVRPKPTTPAASDNDDLNFLRQVQRLLQRPTSTRMPIQTKSTTSTSAINTNPGTTTTTTTTISSTSSTPKLEIYMLSKNKNENNGPTSTFDDLLNSFQKEPTTTTRRPQLTTFSDADDIAFLKGLRQIAVDTSTTKTTRNPDFAKQIIAQLGLNQTSNTPETPLNADGYPRVPTVNRVEIEKNKKDVASLNTDLQLLSTLLGRPISQKDIPQLLTKQASTQAPTSTTARTTTATKTTVSPKIIQEIELLHQIAKKPDQPAPDNDLTSTDELAAIDPSEAYGKTNDALLATLLKQRGIGPAHNNIPLNIYSTTTTPRPRYQTPSRSPRPLLDGLSWLWKQWQDTAPGQGGYAPQSSRTRTRGANSETAAAAAATATDSGTSFDHFDDGLDSDTSSIPLDQSHTTNGNSGFGFGLPGGGGQLLSAALGVTKLVTNFLGSALQGAGKTFQSAWSTQAFGSAGGGGGGGIGGGGDYFRLSG